MLNKLKSKIAFAIVLFVVASGMIFIGKEVVMAGSVETVTEDKIQVRQNAVKLKKEEIINNLEKNDVANVIDSVGGQKDAINITFTGMTDRESMNSILSLLDEYDKKASFFVQGVKAAENGTLLNEIKNIGHIVGNYALLGLEKIENMSSDRIIEEFAQTNVIFEEIMGQEPVLFMSGLGQHNDEVLKISKASGYENVVQGTKFINYTSFNSYEEVLTYIKSLKSGTMLTFKLDEAIDEIELELSKPEINEDIDKTEKDDHDLVKPKEEIDLPKSERLLQTVGWMIKAVDQMNYEIPWDEYIPEYEKARVENDGKLSGVVNEIYTTTKGVSFTFSKIGREDVLDETLKALEKIDAKATFFVTGREALSYKEQISKIKSAGHEIANGGFSGDSLSEKSFIEICEEIHKTEVILEDQGVFSKLFMPAHGVSSKVLEEAVSSMGYKMVTYTSTPVREEYQNMDAKDIVYDYYQKYPALRRGNIVNSRLDYYTDPQKVSRIIEEIYESKIKNIGYYKQGDINNDSGYKVMTVSELLANTYTYPVPESSLGEPSIYIGQLDQKNKFEIVKNGYIGTPHKRSTESLKGFNYKEIKELNNVGTIDTNGENTIFLTFDDWGSDVPINQILYVLEKHNVPGTFFIRTEFVHYNPNLLRAIAEEGHDVCSHTSTHYLVDINHSQIPVLQHELILSYKELQNIIGDLEELKLFFRPPTLAVSKIGIETILDAGYSHVVNGDFSTKDYEAKSAEELKNKLANGMLINKEMQPLQPGSVVVMHMTDESAFTAEALDMFFTENAKKSDDDPTKYKFAKLSDYL